MTKKWARLAGLLVCALILASSSAPASASPAQFSAAFVSSTHMSSDPLSTTKTKVQLAADQVYRLAAQLQGLLDQYNDSNEAVQAESGNLAVAKLRLLRAKTQASDAKLRLDQRARAAYITGIWGEAKLVAGSESVSQFMTYARFLRRSMADDRAAYVRYGAVASQVEQQASSIDRSRIDLMASTTKLESVKQQVSAALANERSVLVGAQAELSRLQAERQRQAATAKAAMETLRRKALGAPGRASVAAEAMRSSRQRELDAKLAALLSWYAPGSGDEPFTRPMLAPTGIVTVAKASWYGADFDGQRASSGATYNMGQLTAASLILPFGTLLKVTLGSRSAVVVITDRGPYVVDRLLDLSAGAAQAIGLTSRGVAQVRMEIMSPIGQAPRFP
ncbi:MAG: septal ring lytic transglycosylase RlpA family protein [Actinomycetota bacterium]|nr:septal ring lytic transglycosylase RlpA family protein [Actinomycetota bacterium]